MNALRTGNWTKKVLAALLLCGLLFQNQTVFACQMMDHSGPIEQCCCDDMASRNGADKVPEAHSACCDIGTQLAVKVVDTDKDEPVLVSSQATLDPPPTPLIFLLVTLWPELAPVSPSPVILDPETNPGHPGTHTYLATLRLRI